MNKLEELKALLEEEKESLNEYNSACKANDDVEDVKSLGLSHRLANKCRLGLSEELLPHLIAVAEAAQEMMNKAEAEICTQDRGCSYDSSKISPYELLTKLEPLTKDADK
jgi:hypothetical protein